MRYLAILLAAICVVASSSTTTSVVFGANGAPFDAVFAEDAAAREAAMTALRAEGPPALDRLFQLRSDLERVASSATVDTKRSVAKWSLRRLDRAIDQVGGQRYCTVSRLYWYTDIESAKAAAQQSGKPILSLRMLGNLTDEYSCANSRFFRTTLYSNEEISRTLRENFVLHWKSVRPVPVVTIDFGDGRMLKRTLTGNSAHYLLAPDGRPLDVLPGLYHPQAFLAWLASAAQLSNDYAAAEPEARDALLSTYHADRHRLVLAAWQNDLVKIGAARPPAAAQARAALAAAPPPAPVAALEARTKSRIEVPILRLLAEPAEPQPADLENSTDDEQWATIAALYRYKVDLDDASIEIIRAELAKPDAARAGELAVTKKLVEDPIVRMVRSLEDSIALDSIRNEYRLHSRIHRWFANGEAAADVDVLNERVYAELFLTPSSDPWLGLAPSDVYTALDNAGVVATP